MAISFDDACAALKQSGLEDGDIVFSHHNLAFFGLTKDCASMQDLVSFWLRAFEQVLGENGTLILPAFTYSFGSDKDEKLFNPSVDTTSTGSLGNSLIGDEHSARSLDPMLSVICRGGQAEELTSDIGNICFGENSIWHRMHERDAKFCNLNLDSGSTFMHWVEREAKVPHREDIHMSGKIDIDGVLQDHSVIYTGRSMSDPDSVPYFSKFHRICVDNGVTSQVKLGRGQINTYKVRNMSDLLFDTLQENPFILTMRSKTNHG